MQDCKPYERRIEKHIGKSVKNESTEPYVPIKIKPKNETIKIDLYGVHFRCSQKVQGFIKTTGKSIDILIQPIDMNPESVAKCDCNYEINIEIDNAYESHEFNLNVYIRGDNFSGNNNPHIFRSRKINF